jgi:NADH dehydrogenase
VGDCASIPDIVQGGTAPPTAQYALREARHAAGNILASVKGGMPRPFRHRNLGVFVPLGRFSGAAEVLGLKLSGFLAWWLYRTYYLFHLPRFDRKVKVLIDWNLELLFHRDIVKQDVTVSESVSRAHFEPGQVIFHQGDLAQRFYVILAGTVRVHRDLDGKVDEVATLRTGEYFGEIALLEGERHSASVEAVTAVDVLTMSGPEFKALATSSTHFGELLASITRQRLRDNEQAESRDG